MGNHLKPGEQDIINFEKEFHNETDLTDIKKLFCGEIYKIINKEENYENQEIYINNFKEVIKNHTAFKSNILTLLKIYNNDPDINGLIPKLANQSTRDLNIMMNRFPNISLKQMAELLDLELNSIHNIKYIYHYLPKISIEELFSIKDIITKSNTENVSYIYDKFPNINKFQLIKIKKLLKNGNLWKIKNYFRQGIIRSFDDLISYQNEILLDK